MLFNVYPKNMIKKINLLLILCLFVTGFYLKDASAEDVQNVPFNIFLELPNNQKEGVTSYFNLSVQPSETQYLTVVLTNTTNKEITVQLSPANAINSPKGGIVYVRERSEEHASLEDEQYYMDQYIQVPSEVVIAPNAQTRVAITVNTPNKNEGALLGGILFNLKDAGSVTTQSTDQTLSFTANYALNIGIPIQLNFPISKDNEPLGVGGAEEETLPTGSSIGVDVNNPNEALIHDVSYRYEILNEDDEIVSKGTVPSFNISPRSHFKLQLPWDSNAYQAGKYKVSLTPSYSDKEIVREFEITREDVKEYTEITGQEPTIPILNIPFYAWIIGIISLLLSIFGAYRFGKRKVNSMEEVA